MSTPEDSTQEVVVHDPIAVEPAAAIATAPPKASSRGPTIERVFPIRIQLPKDIPIADGPLPSLGLPLPILVDSSKKLPPVSPQLGTSFDPVAPSISIGQPPEATFEGTRYITNRFNFVQGSDESSASPESSGPLPSPGQRIYRCEDEPIHIPGAIQSFGALLAVKKTDDIFSVRIVSENIYNVVGIKPEHLFEVRCFTDVLPESERNSFCVRAHELYVDQSRKIPDVFPLSVMSLEGAPVLLFCAMHYNPESDLLVCEFELEQDAFNPTSPPNDILPGGPITVVHHEVDPSQRLLSTTNRSKPVRALEVARKSSKPLGPMDLFQILSEIQDQLGAANSLPELLDIIVGLVYELTGFHRVMVYQFDEATAGSVVSEIVNPLASEDIYRGLHFPASDIPKQARELYLVNKIRVLYNRDQQTARLICRTLDDTKIPLDLKHSYLRAMSPIHIKYLANMGVQASMSISLIVNESLWGLISCHNYGSVSGMRISLPMREVCRGLGNIASSNIEKHINISRINARNALTKASPKNSPFAYITSSSTDLLSMFQADFGFLAIRGEARTIGKLAAYSEAIALLQYIRRKSFTTIFHTNSITRDCPDINYGPGFKTLSGMLVIPLTLSGSEFLVFLRNGQQKNISWAGNPYEKTGSAVTNYLKPRSSFKRWSESVIGTSIDWSEESIDSAALLSILYGRFIEVWRQKEAIVQRNRMTRLLIRNAGHEVRTPLNSIINYLEMALEEELDERAHTHLYRSLEASKSLVFVVNDLLNLTEAEDTSFQIQESNIDLRSIVAEVVRAFEDEATRRSLEIIVEDDPAVPQLLRCNPSGLRQVISNILANSIKSSTNGRIHIGLKHILSAESSFMIQINFKDEGMGLSEEQLDSIFQDFEQVMDDTENNTSDDPGSDVGTAKIINIGLGLATTARFVRLNYGQISMSSAGIGKGTEVCVTLPFRKAVIDNLDRHRLTAESSLPLPPSDSLDLRISSGKTEGLLEIPDITELPSSASSGSSSVQLDTAFPTEITSPSESNMSRYPFPLTIQAHVLRNNPKVIIAEDNPLNSRLLDTRLRRSGYDTSIAVDGQACFQLFKLDPDPPFHSILMDIQMPLIDGIEATRLIRALEENNTTSSPEGSPRLESQTTLPRKRIPIIAVSASLAEHRINEYISAGFDAWILKPIDFKRLEIILASIDDAELRKGIMHGIDAWEKGGWFNEVEPIS